VDRNALQLVSSHGFCGRPPLTHAESGTIASQNSSGITQFIEDPSGPKLNFAANEALTLRDLDQLNFPWVPGGFKLGGRPLVILNGCETGTWGFYSTSAYNYPGTFLKFGARGVIVTDAPVWAAVASKFGARLMTRLAKGENVPSAILATKQELMSKEDDPLGLLYSYYGGTNVSINLSKVPQQPLAAAVAPTQSICSPPPN
jgi:CHAT domain